MKIKKNVLIITLLLLIVILIGFLYTLRKDPNEMTLDYAATGFIQLKEYSDDLESSLTEAKLEQKLEDALSAFQKVNQARDAIMYLRAVDTQSTDYTLILQRLSAMSNNVQNYIITISQGKSLNPDTIIKDISDGRKIVNTLDYRLVGQGKFELIKAVVDELGREFRSRQE